MVEIQHNTELKTLDKQTAERMIYQVIYCMSEQEGYDEYSLFFSENYEMAVKAAEKFAKTIGGEQWSAEAAKEFGDRVGEILNDDWEYEGERIEIHRFPINQCLENGDMQFYNKWKLLWTTKLINGCFKFARVKDKRWHDRPY